MAGGLLQRAGNSQLNCCQCDKSATSPRALAAMTSSARHCVASASGEYSSVCKRTPGMASSRRKAVPHSSSGNLLLITTCILLYLLGNTPATECVVPAVTGLRSSVEWNGVSGVPVSIAARAVLTPSDATINSLAVTHNFTSSNWTVCPFTNLTCSSEVKPSAKVRVCTLKSADNLIESNTNTMIGSNVSVLQIDASAKHILTFNSSLDGSIAVLLWMRLWPGHDDVMILRKDIPGTFGPIPVYVLETTQNRSQLKLYGQSILENFIFSFPSVDYLRQTSSWHHVAMTRSPQGNVSVFLDSQELTMLTSSSTVAAPSGTAVDGLQLGGAARMQVGSVHILAMSLNASDVQCIYGCLERFVIGDRVPATVGNLKVTSKDGGQTLLVSGSATSREYQSTLQSLRLVSNDAMIDPEPRDVILTLTDDCSNSTYLFTVYQSCAASNLSCTSPMSTCLLIGTELSACFTQSDLSSLSTAINTNSVCTMPTTAAATASSTTTSDGIAVTATSAGLVPTPSNSSAAARTPSRLPVTSQQQSITSPMTPSTKKMVTTSDEDENNPIIAGVSDGFAIGIIIISIVVISLISVLVVFMVRHYRAQQVMVVGKNNGDADQKMPTTTARRRYQYRSYAATQAVQLQSSKNRPSSFIRGNSLSTGQTRHSVYDDFGMSPQDLESDPRQEVRDLNAAFYKTPGVTANIFFKPSIVPMKKNAFALDTLPTEAGDKQSAFFIPRNRSSSSRSQDDEVITALPGLDDNDPFHERAASDSFALGDRRPSKGSMDLVSQQSDSEANLLASGGHGRHHSDRDDLHLNYELDDKVLQLTRAGTKKVRRNSITGLKRHGIQKGRDSIVPPVIIGNQMTSII